MRFMMGTTLRLTLMATVITLATTTEPVEAEFVFGQRARLEAPFNSPADDWSMSMTADGLTAVFSSTRSGGYGSDDLWVVTRTALNEPWGEPVNLGPSVNTGASEGYPSISPDGLTLLFSEMFASTTSRPLRPGGRGGQDLWMTTRPTTEDNWGTPVNLGAVVNSTADDRCPCISSDGLSLYFGSNRPGSSELDLWVSTRPDKSSPWTTPVNLGPAVNSADDDSDPSLSPDGLTLFFASWGRPGGLGSHDLYVSTRTSGADSWGQAVNLGPAVNSATADGCPYFWAGGPTLFFVSYRASSGFDFWELPITPLADFNGDGRIDGDEVRAMAVLWGQDAPVADIAPVPFGDGKIDVRDLLALAEYIGGQVDDATLIAHWAMDEAEGLHASDSAGGNDGMIVGSSQWRPESGRVNGALELSGTAFISAGHALNPANGPFSILAWVKGGLPGQTVISLAGAADLLTADAVTGALATGLAKRLRGGAALSSAATITDGKWHRIALTWDGTSRRLYVGSILVAEDIQGSLASFSGELVIGAGRNMAPGTFWTGLVDDVRIYNRVVRP